MPCVRIILRYKKSPVGHCNLLKQEDTVKLADIIIYCQQRPIVCFLPFITRGSNYRKRGFGTLLLGKAIELCLEMKVSKIVGQAHGELEILIPWYRKHNFVVDVDNNLMLDLRKHCDLEIK